MQKESRYFELIRLQQDSGLTVREFCSNESIAPATYYYWRKKLKNSKGKKDFIPLIVKSPESAISQGFDRYRVFAENLSPVLLVHPVK